MTPVRCTAEILELIRARDWVTFLEIRKLLDAAGVPVAGDLAVCHRDDPNLVMWSNMSSEFVAEVEAVANHPEIVLSAGSQMAYAVSGGMLTLPIASRRGHNNPHWLVMFFRPAMSDA